MEEKKGRNSYNLKAITATLDMKDDEPVKHHANLTVLTGTVFIVGEVAGGGILSLPNAVAGAGWFGLVLIAWCCANAGFAGICLAKSWLILEERYPEYKVGLTRKPFATIGQKAYGTWASFTKLLIHWKSVAVSLSMNITRFGTSTVFLLISAGLLESLMTALSAHSLTHWGVCSWTPIVGIVLLPFMFLGSPGDFWPAAYTAMFSTILGSILLLVNIGIESKDHIKSATYPMPTFKSFFLSFGNILFAFGGASAFPNFQNDMKNKEEFPKAVIYGFIGLLLLYIPVSGGGYGVFGINVASNIIQNMNASTLTTVIEFCFLIHCFFAFLIIINPVLLELEEVMNIPKDFNLWRVVFRTIMMVGLIFLGESVPTFGRILDLIGGSTITLMAFIMPPAFYFKLCSDRSGQWPQHHIPLYQRLILLQIAIVGIIGGIASTYSSIDSFLDPNSELEPACYVGHSNKTYFYKD